MSLRTHLKFAAKAAANLHRPGALPDIFLFATPRGGSTWVMEIIASQPGMKFYDEPLNPRRENVARSGLFPNYDSLMPETGDPQRIIRFLRDLQAGRRGYMNPTPFRPNHRFLTNRVVFKIHEIEHLMAEVVQRCRGMLVYLIRHPIATSISRHALPRLDLFLKSPYYSDLLGDSHGLREIRRVAEIGSPLQRAILSWCYENLVALKRPHADWLFVTYEEMVLNPSRACDLLLTRLQLPDRSAMLAAFERPSTNISMSRELTLDALRTTDLLQRRSRLVTKWQQGIAEAQYVECAQLLAAFGIDAYDARQPLATARFLHFDDTRHLLEDAQVTSCPSQ